VNDGENEIAGSESSPGSDLLRLEFLGANSAASMSGAGELSARTNYFIGSDPTLWRRDVVNFAKVKCQSIYPGIDLIYYGNHRELEYDFVVAPGANPAAIRLRFGGARNISLNAERDLVVRAEAGEIRQRKPVVYQDVNGIRTEIGAGYLVDASGEVSFEIAAYDTSKQLVIDPVLAYSTYLGKSDEAANDVAVDSTGSTYIVGRTNTQPVGFAGGPPRIVRSGSGDVFVTRLNPTGTDVVYTTYLGGRNGDTGTSIAADSEGNAYLAGMAGSGFPVTPNAFKKVADYRDGFVSKLNSTGGLVYSTYLDGVGVGDGKAIAVDSQGFAYVTGSTTQGGCRTVAGQGNCSVTKLNRDGSALVYSRCIGPAGSVAIAVDSVGSAFVAGQTNSPDFPTTAGAFQRQFLGGEGCVEYRCTDVVVSKLDPAGSQLIYSTYLGGTGGDHAAGIAVDPSGKAIVTGYTSSTDFPTTAGAVQVKKANRYPYSYDVFVTRLNAEGDGLIYSTYLGGNGGEMAGGVAVDSFGNAYVTGITGSTDIPVINAFQPMNAGGPSFKTMDGGQVWRVMTKGLASSQVFGLAIDPVNTSTVYASTDAGVYKSTDGGGNWAAINEGLPERFGWRLAIDAQSPTTVYAAAAGIYKSVDRGGTWQATGLKDGANSVVIDPSRPETLYAPGSNALGGGVYKSTDSGDSWTFDLIYPQNSRFFVAAIDPRSSSIVYAGEFDRGVFKSTDGGTTWTAPAQSFHGISALVIDPRDSSVLYVGTSYGVFKSTDGARSWVFAGSGLRDPQVRSLVIDPTTPSILYAATGAGVFKTEDGGARWFKTNAGLPESYVSALAVDPKNPSALYAGTSVTLDVFIAKLNTAGAALEYLTLLGGGGDEGDYGLGIAVDTAGNAYVAGSTRSKNFPLEIALQPDFAGGDFGSFVAKIDSSRGNTPSILSASVNRKKLLVSGKDFDLGAVILVDGKPQKSSNDELHPGTVLIAPKAARGIQSGQTVEIRVRNSNGMLSAQFNFTR
jgi:hypothetical protein